MKNAFCLAILLLATALALGQTPKGASKLKKFSPAQLKACFDDKTICGTGDIYEITDELVRRLPSLPSDVLVKCFDDWKICGTGEGPASGWPISDELARRGNPHLLLVRYWTEPNESIRYGIVHVAYHSKSPEVVTFMRKVLDAGKGDEDFIYWPAKYLAKRCDTEALAWFSTRNQRSQSCMEYPSAIELIGKCRYRPAIPYLLHYSLHDACLNIDDAAVDDLHKLYPGGPKSFESLDSARSYYCKKATQEGFKIECIDK